MKTDSKAERIRKQLTVVGGVVTLFAAAVAYLVLRAPTISPRELTLVPSSEAPELRARKLVALGTAKPVTFAPSNTESDTRGIAVSSDGNITLSANRAAADTSVTDASNLIRNPSPITPDAQSDPYAGLRELRDSGRLQVTKEDRERRAAEYLAGVVTLEPAQPSGPRELAAGDSPQVSQKENPYDALRQQLAEQRDSTTSEQLAENRRQRFLQYVESASRSAEGYTDGDR